MGWAKSNKPGLGRRSARSEEGLIRGRDGPGRPDGSSAPLKRRGVGQEAKIRPAQPLQTPRFVPFFSPTSLRWLLPLSYFRRLTTGPDWSAAVGPRARSEVVRSPHV